MSYTFNPFTGNFDAVIASTSGTTINQYSSLKAPQLFNPDSTAVSADTDIYALSGTQDIAFVTLNGQTLDDSEYSLSVANLTVTPDNGFNSTSDEVLVFQASFTVTGGGGATFDYVAKTSTYTITNDDYIIDATSNTFAATLPTASGETGRQFIIKNSGTGVVTVTPDGSETIDGEATAELSMQYDSITVVSDGSNWIIV